MRSNCDGRGRWNMKFATGVVGVALLVWSGQIAGAQTAPDAPSSSLPVQTFYLTNVSQSSDANDLTSALRNLLDPHDKIYLVLSQNAIVVQGTHDQLMLAR